MMPVYSRLGIQSAWSQQCFDFVATSKVCSKANRVNGIDVNPPSTLLFPELLKNDTEVHVYPRPIFLEKWVFAPNCHCSVAVDSNGSVVGYGVVRITLGNVNGWRITPLFADSSDIARTIYQDLCAKVAAEDQEAAMTVDVSYGKDFSPESLKLAYELQAIPTFTMFRFYSKGIPPGMPLNKVFVIT